jgi:hypothetical protein
MEQEYQKPTIGAMPQKPLARSAVDFLSGGLTNRDSMAFDSKEERFMKLANLLTTILGGAAGKATGMLKPPMSGPLDMRQVMMEHADDLAKPMDMTPNIRKFLPPQKMNNMAEYAPVGGEEAYNVAAKAAVPQVPQDGMYQHLMRYFSSMGQQ